MQNLTYFLKKLDIQDKTIVVAVSTGVDSMVLLTLLNKYLNKEIVVAHINHNIRKESDAEAIFLEKYCNDNGFVYEKYTIEKTPENNFEEYARNLRLNFYKQVADKYKTKYIFTGHHLDDLAETIIMTLIRGGSFASYKGFDPLLEVDKYYFVKPLIFLDKKAIYKYAEANKIIFFEDYTNKEDIYTRNRIRNNILPLMKKENPKVLNNIYNFSRELSDASKYIDGLLQKKIKDIIVDKTLYIDLLLNEEFFIQKKIIEYYLANIIKIENFTKKNIKQLMDIINKNGSQEIKLNKINIYKINNILTPIRLNLDAYYQELDIRKVNNHPLFNFVFGDYSNDNNSIGLSSKDIRLPLILRSNKEDDYIQMENGRQKVRKVLKDEKISKYIRNNYPVLVDSSEKVLWIPSIKRSIFSKQDLKKCDIIIKCERKEHEKL